MLLELLERFLKEKQFLANISPKTVRSYRQAFNAYQRVLNGSGHSDRDDVPTKDTLKDFVIGMREAGLSPGACNVYIRSINSFLTWLHTEGYVTESLRLRQLPQPKKVIPIFSEKHVQALIRFKPKDHYQWRLYTLICLLIDTGARIDEGLTALVSGVDLDNLVVKVRGKGDKERLLPISIELRKILWVYLSKHRFKVPSDYLFPTRHGAKLEYHNTLRDEEITNANFKTGWVRYKVGTLALDAIGDFQRLRKEVIVRLLAFEVSQSSSRQSNRQDTERCA
jgi:site-specific recombinase XerD